MINKVKYTGEETGFVNIFYEDGSVKNIFSECEEVQQYIADGGVVEPAYTEEELAEYNKQKQISDAKQYLSSTDWVVVKINEANINGDDISSLLTKYADILTARADARATINSLE